MTPTGTKRHIHTGRGFLFVVLILLVAPLLAAVDSYRFTYTNPSIGNSNAPFILEYYSLVDCEPCAHFETLLLQPILEIVASGELRIIFRDIFPSDE